MNDFTYIFKDSIDKNIPFKPMQTIVSEDFGRHFFIDLKFHFLSAPSYSKKFIESVLFDTDMMKDEKLAYDESQIDYVGGWTELGLSENLVDDTFIDIDSLLEIYRTLCFNQWQEDRNEVLRVYYEKTQRAFWYG